MFEEEKVFKAYRLCRRNKRRSTNAMDFEKGFEKKLLKLSSELQSKKYCCGKSVCFVVEHPKLREVFASDFRDRIVHHLLVSKLESRLEQTFSHSSFACRKGKGTLEASRYLRKMMFKVTKSKKKKAYYGQFDVKSFFMSIDKKVLIDILSEKVYKRFGKPSDVMWLCEKIINHDPTTNYYLKSPVELLSQIPKHKSLFGVEKGKGLPIGNLTSQFFANVYLNELDQYVKRVLKVKYYVRYVDDFVLLSDNPDEIVEWREKISEFLKNRLKLELQGDKDKYGSVYSGVDFVGYIVKPHYVLTRNRIVCGLKQKLHLFNAGFLVDQTKSKQELLPIHLPPSQKDIEKILCTVNSYYGYLKHSNSFKLRKNIFEKHFKVLKNYVVTDKNFNFFKLAQE